MTVTGTTVPSSFRSCVMPTFLPSNPFTISISQSPGRPESRDRDGGSSSSAFPEFLPSSLCVLSSKGLNLDIDAGGQVEFHQCVHRLRRRLQDVEKALVSADFELFARLLIHVRRTQ